MDHVENPKLEPIPRLVINVVKWDTPLDQSLAIVLLPFFFKKNAFSRYVLPTCTATTERTSTEILLNSSKQPHAPVWERPL